MHFSLWSTVAVLAVFDTAVASKISQHQGGILARGYNFTSVTTCLETRSTSKFSSTTTISYIPSISSSSVEEYPQQTSASSSYDPYPPVSLSTQHAPSVAFHQSSTVLQSSRSSITTKLNVPVAASDTPIKSSMWKSSETPERVTSTTTLSVISNTPSITSIVPQFTSTLISVGPPLSDVNSLTVKPTSTTSSFRPQSTTLNTSIQLDTTTFKIFTFSETSTITITQPASSVTRIPQLPQSELISSSTTRSVLFPFFPSSTLEIPPTSTLSILIPATTTQPAPILFGTQTLSQDSYSNLIFGSQTLLPGSAITVNGQFITLASSGGAIIINPASTPISQTSNPSSSGVPAPESFTSNPTTTISSSPAVVVVDGSSITANPSTGFVIGTQTLYPGNGITESGEVLTLPSLPSTPTASPSLAPFGNGTIGFANSTISQTPSTLVTSASQAQITSLQIAGQTLTQGGVVTILDEVLSLVSGSAVVVVKTIDTTAPAASTSTGVVHKSRGRRIESFGLLLVGIQGLLVVLVSGFWE